MRYIALEEAFSIPGLGTPLRQMPLRPKKEYAESWQRGGRMPVEHSAEHDP
jgi:hypothetical protein